MQQSSDVPLRREPPSFSGNEHTGHLKPPLLGVAIAAIFMFVQPTWLDDTFIEEDVTLPQRISYVPLEHGHTVNAGVSHRALRGSGGDPIEFQWVFTDTVATVGTQLRTRVLALDSSGRAARASACGLLRLNVSLSGHARVSNLTSNRLWQWEPSGSLDMSIENNVAETVDVDFRIESPLENADVLIHSTKVTFVPASSERFVLHLQPMGSPTERAADMIKSSTRGVWPVSAVLEALLISYDRFGNMVKLQPHDIRGFTLKSSSTSLKTLSFFKADSNGVVRSLIRGTRPEELEVWLDHDSMYDVKLRQQTAQRVRFLDLSLDRPHNVSLEKVRDNMSDADSKWSHVADSVRDEFIHAWQSYRRYAWGADELMPLSKKGKDTFGNIGITILDSLSTLYLMGLSDEFEEATAWVSRHLNFDRANREVSVFEIVIRALGGLLGGYALSGRQVFLDKATDLGNRLLGACNTSSGMPYPRWDLARKRGSPSGEPTILAEAGSLQLEFRYLSALTGDVRYREAGDRSFEAIRSAGAHGLMPVHLTAPDETPVMSLRDAKIATGALADSYYEYLLKQWLQNPREEEFKHMFVDVMRDIPTLVRGNKTSTKNSNRLRLIESTSKGNLIWKQDHLSCFVPGMIALGLRYLPADDLQVYERNTTWRLLAKGLTEGCVEMWSSTRSHLSPEFVPISDDEPFKLESVPPEARHSFIRPETAEALFYMYRLTGDERYRKHGQKLFNAIVKHSKVPGGYASVKDVTVTPTNHLDEMQSFVMAETFKYLFLLFSPSEVLDLDRFVLNTEGHPFQRLGPF